MTDAETIIARVLGEQVRTYCGITDVRPAGYRHLAAEIARALRDAALLPEATTRVEWGSRTHSEQGEPWDFMTREQAASGWPKRVGPVLRRTRTTYADHVTEWEPAE